MQAREKDNRWRICRNVRTTPGQTGTKSYQNLLKSRVVTDIVEWVRCFGLYTPETYWATRLLLLMPTWSTKDCTGQATTDNSG